MRVQQAIAFFAIIILGACAQQTATKGTSIIDPNYQGGYFTALAVEAETGLQEREAIEQTAAGLLQKSGLHVQRSLDILPPTRDYSQSSRKRAMQETGLQGLLVVTPSGKQVIEDYIPPGRSPFYGAYGYGRHGGHGTFGIGTGLDFGYDPGVVLREPQASYVASIYTLPGFKRVWTGEFSTRGGTGMDFNAVASRFAGALVQRLRQDGMIAP